SVGPAGGEGRMGLEVLSGVIAVAGILLAALLFLGKRQVVESLAASAPGRLLGAWWQAAWGFDWLYDKLFVQPYLWLCRLLGRDPIDRSFGAVTWAAQRGNRLATRAQTGQTRWYALSIVEIGRAHV